MNSFEIRWDPRAVFGIPVVTVGLSLAAVGANCFNKMPEATISVEGKVGCTIGNLRLLDPSNALSNVSASGTASGSQVQMSLIPSLDAIDSAQAVIDLYKIFLSPIQPIQSQEYLA